MKVFSKEILRSITHSWGRFIAIALISLLGAGFYAGLRMAAPDMKVTADQYFDQSGLYDISLVSNCGLDDTSLDLLADVSSVDLVCPAYRSDVVGSVKGKDYAVALESLPLESRQGKHFNESVNENLNEIELLEGRMPTSSHEIVIGKAQAEKNGIEIGSTLKLNANGDKSLDMVDVHEYTIVGFVATPLYFSKTQLGITSIKTGSIEIFGFVQKDAFKEDIPYSLAYLKIDGAANAAWDSDAYNDIIKKARDEIGRIVPRIEEARFESLKKQALDEAYEKRDEAIRQEIEHSFSAAAQNGVPGAAAMMNVDAMVEQARASQDNEAFEREVVDSLPNPEVYICDLSKNLGVVSYQYDVEGIKQIATFLPFMFFLVAILVVLTSMTRMVDEERLEIGTLTALGYSKAKIVSKYLIYGISASGIGALIGIIVFGKLLPWFILSSYAVSYDFREIALPLDTLIFMQAFFLSLGITCLSTILAALASLRENPASLMLPKAPKPGKRILLERITPLWKRMSFSQKITARNLLRYKRRFFMAVIGVAGCTALLMVGFGLRNLIGSIVAEQYENIITYDMSIGLVDDKSLDVRDETPQKQSGLEDRSYKHSADMLEEQLREMRVSDFTPLAQSQAIVGTHDDKDMRLEIMVALNPDELVHYVNLKNPETQEIINLNSHPSIVSEKVANELGLKVGDTVRIFDENTVGDRTGEGHICTIYGICENYLGHYLYLAPDYYKDIFSKDPLFDHYLIAVDNDWTAELSDTLLQEKEVSTIDIVAEKIQTYKDMLAIMDKLIVVIALLAAALAFVVLYNLSNINICERVREIATLKVLGFKRIEIVSYIFREIFIMTALGAVLGCILGVPLTFSIARSAETVNMMFGRTIEPLSFVISFLVTLGFSFIVALAMMRKLDKVDMVESLKSVE